MNNNLFISLNAGKIDWQSSYLLPTVFELNIEMPFLWRWWLPLTLGLLVFPHCTLWLSINSNARGSCSLAGVAQDTTFILLKQIVISKFLQPSEIWQRLWGEYLVTRLCVGSANTSCSKQESSRLFFELSYRGLEVASNLLIIRPESTDPGPLRVDSRNPFMLISIQLDFLCFITLPLFLYGSQLCLEFSGLAIICSSLWCNGRSCNGALWNVHLSWGVV